MKINDPDILHVVKTLRGIFPEKMYIGGSFAINTIFPQIPYDDIDVFIVSDRIMETWPLLIILNTIFDRVDTSNMAFYYKITGQYLYLRCYYKNRKYDLIFLNEGTDLVRTCGSTLSSIFYKVTYYAVTKSPNILFGIKSNKDIIELLAHKRICNINEKQCTKSYLEKTISRCEQLDLRIIEH